MGDMKTPDFDDLLAAFDIPDMVDPKAAIESGQDDQENHIKHHAHTDEDCHVPTSSDVGVSVIVKNIRIDYEGLEKDGHHSSSNGLHNGFLTVSNLEHFSRDGIASMKNLSATSEGALRNCVFNQFSPISSADEFDDDDRIEVVDPPDKDERHSGFSASMLTRSFSQQEYDRFKAIGRETFNKRGNSFANQFHNFALNGPERQRNSDVSVCEPYKDGHLQSKLFSERLAESMEHEEAECVEKEETDKFCDSQFNSKVKASAKLSSCIAAIQALSSTKVSPAVSKELQCNSVASSPLPKEVYECPVLIEESAESLSLIDGANNKLPVKQPDSPRSISSESSSKGSPSSPAGTTPAIPKVRIKTIKTSSGEIKRTVTRVLPEFELDSLKLTSEENSSLVVPTLLSSPFTTVLSSPSRTSLHSTAVTNTATATEFSQKHVTIKPVATAFLPVSAVKTAGSQVINLKLANNTTVKATVISASSVQSASSAIIKAANAIQQQTVVVPASSIASSKLVPKTVHLANLNLLPQGVQTTSELRQVLTKPQQHLKQTLVSTIATQLPKNISRVQVVASSQSSVVEAFNKVLSSVNPVPIYIPNLSPPVNSGITLPSRGYKCLECGDSFALEKSLLQHYDRRSVRIEVTCNHCTQNLIFYNKCSLLSHARGHKEKGVVMQCSHLILKPVPVDQMIASNFSFVATNALFPSSLGIVAPTTVKIQSSDIGTVISAPINAPIVPAMPLEEDPSKLCRHNLKCLECSEIFQDETTLATHFQHAADASGQKTCSICQMLLPNPCSFSSHQRIHQHKSPYTCPECGAICRSAHFQTHVTKNCLHYTRRIGYRCLHCNVVYADVVALKSHIRGSHCEVFYKCPICPMAFKSAPNMHSHAYTQHPGVKIGEPKTIYKCSMCDTVFTLHTLLYRHFNQHIEHQKVPVFKCPDCSFLYAQKQLMMDHIKTMHGTLKSVEGPPNLGTNISSGNKPSLQNAASHNKEDMKLDNGLEQKEKKPTLTQKGGVGKKTNSGWTCWDCDQLFMQRDAYITHMKKDHGKQMKKHPCRQCEKSFSSSHSLCRHNRIKHKGIRKVYNCLQCPDKISTFMKRSLLEKHIQLTHENKDNNAEDLKEATIMEEAVVKEDLVITTPKRKLEEPPTVEFSTRRGAISQPLKKLKINVFKVHKCAVCGFTTENLLQFHEHIPQHKSDGSSYQCRECGLCYTSHVSLSRHLFIIHKLKESQPVSKQNGSGEENHKENSSMEDGLFDDTELEKRCKVCAKTFDSEAALNTHMRTHGMAFIKSKRMNSVEK